MENSNQIIKTQVIIAGAGPTGLSLAAQMLRYNIDFIIIEKNEKPTSLSKALVVQARTLEILKELGLSEKAIQKGKVTTALNLFYNGKQKASINFAGMGKGLSSFPYALSLEQSKTEELFVDYILAHGKNIRWKSEFSHVEQNENGVAVYFKDSEGTEQKIEGSYLVGCDGASSLVRHQMNLSFEGNTALKIFYVADVRIKSSVINKNELFFFLIEKGFILFFPMEGNEHYRIVGILPDATENEQLKFDDIENYIKQQIVSPLEFAELIWFSSYKIHSRKANSFMNGRCFIAGDAAHIHTPAGGQGMNTGIQDAYNLAWKIAYTIRKEVNAEVLKTYNSERTANAKNLLQTTDRLFDFMAGSTGFWNLIRLHFFPLLAALITKFNYAKRKAFILISQTGISYRESFLTVKSSIGKVKAGVRMPYFVFTDSKEIFDYLCEPVFKILFFGNENKNVNHLTNKTKIKMNTYSFKEIPASLFGSATDFYILLRPDNHISYIGRDINICEELLNKIS